VGAGVSIVGVEVVVVVVSGSSVNEGVSPAGGTFGILRLIVAKVACVGAMHFFMLVGPVQIEPSSHAE